MKYSPKLYLESTIFNFYCVEKDSQKKNDTHKMFEIIKKGKYEVFTSEYVVKELSRDNYVKYTKMENLIEIYVHHMISYNEEIDFLTGIYIEKGIIPLKYITDARHIAVAAVHNLDFVVSYNMEHIVKPKTMIGTGLVNLHNGYRQIGLCSPKEILEYD